MTRLLSALALALAAGSALAQPAPDPKKAEAVARATAKQLRAHFPPPVAPGWPDFALRVKETAGGDEYGTDAGWEEWADGTATPYIVVTRSTLAALLREEDALALLLAREHARLALGLTRPKGRGGPAATDADADLFAVKLLLRSGYSARQGLAGLSKLPEKSRPAWLARVAKLLDKPPEPIWRAMPAFECGLTFLAVENHNLAAFLLERVVREFPHSAEACACLGYARLWRAFDSLASRGSPVHLPGHALGSSESIRTNLVARGAEAKLWREALEALRKADELEPNQPPVLALLGLARLLDWNADAAEAEKYLTAAREALKRRPSREGEVELLVNLAVARLAQGKADDARKLLGEAAALAAALPGGPPAQYTRAITFNRALVLAAEGKASEAAKLFIRFLQTTPRFDPWWSEGYRHYKALCKTLNMTPHAAGDLRPPARTQRQAAVLASGKAVRPGGAAAEVLSSLPKPTREERAAAGTLLQRALYAAHGIEIIYQPDEEIFVVAVVSKTAAVPWPVPGRYGAPVGDLRIGMAREEVEALPGGTDFARRPFAPRAGTRVYYPEWELAVVYDGPGPAARVKAVILGPGPR